MEDAAPTTGIVVISRTGRSRRIAETDLGRPLTAMASPANQDDGTLVEKRRIETFVADLETLASDPHSDPEFTRLHAL